MKLRLQITKESGIRFISHLEYLKTLEKPFVGLGFLLPIPKALIPI